MKTIYRSSEHSKAPLSGAVEVNGLVYVSGQIHWDHDQGKLIGGTIEEKLAAALSNAQSILSEAKLTLADVIRVQLYLTNLAELPALNAAYITYFNHPLPVRTAIGVAALPLGANLEIDVIATRNDF